MMNTRVEVETYVKTVSLERYGFQYSPNNKRVTVETVGHEGYASNIIAVTFENTTFYVQADELQHAAEFCRRSMY